MIYRVFVSKKSEFDVYAKKLVSDVRAVLGLEINAKIFLRYDIEGLDREYIQRVVDSVLSEPPVDDVFYQLPPLACDVFAVEYLPGQYDQRADSTAQCIQLLTRLERPIVRCATVYAVEGLRSKAELAAVKGFVINPIETRLASDELPSTLKMTVEPPKPLGLVDNFIIMSRDELREFHQNGGFAMSYDDIAFVQLHFISEGRNPTETELKVIDTYWSDHCRHTTFLTRLENVQIKSNIEEINLAFSAYINLHNNHYLGRNDKYACLMDIATIAAKELKRCGKLDNLDESEEINACSIRVSVPIEGRNEDWLVMFKNETHNHPTEIEPYGGAATCLGGAIRDPLSGRSYVYQAMRVSGSADPKTSFDKTLKGKLPPRVITKTAAAGFSSYGNQIGLATGQVHEYYHAGYEAKRLETGFVVGAAPAENVVRGVPLEGDIVLLIGGATGRDGCGGATGSSKAHDISSLETCGAEVQKGNPLTERKLQRLFRNKEFARLVKRCNDFGAGGVCVAIGELSRGIDIDLSAVPKKYEGLSATELAISESQERMAVVVSRHDEERVRELCSEENIDVARVAEVTALERVRMFLDSNMIVDLPRMFLDSNGARQTAKAVVDEKATDYFDKLDKAVAACVKRADFAAAAKLTLERLDVCSKKGLGEIFDSTIGAGTVFLPFGGSQQLTPSLSMAAKLPVEGTNTDVSTVAAHAFYPYLSESSPFTGAVYAILLSVMKVVLSGAPYDSIRLTLQEYFHRLYDDPKRWGKPVSALLGAMYAQLALGLGAIGGKDSMSGSFEKIDVPPTLISFALGVGDANNLVTNTLNTANTAVHLIRLPRKENKLPNLAMTEQLLRLLGGEIARKNISFATVVEQGGAAAAIIKSCISNGLGFEFFESSDELFKDRIGDILVVLNNVEHLHGYDILPLGKTTADGNFSFGKSKLFIQTAFEAFISPLDGVFPVLPKNIEAKNNAALPRLVNINSSKICSIKSKISISQPRVLIPVFPGTNCEYDMKNRFDFSGAKTKIFVVKNLTSADIEESVLALASEISKCQILAFPGGFSGGDEPDGSGKFIATAFRNARLRDAVTALIESNDGLILGICNGFQALIKLGLLPFGKIAPLKSTSPTLTFNDISRHVSTIARVRVASKLSPWLSAVSVGDVFGVPVSHGEGKFVASAADLSRMISNGQIATQYVNLDGAATYDAPFNPNGSYLAIEGITSQDGRIFGKMGHSERIGTNLYKNVIDDYDMRIFESGVRYFS